MYQKCLEIATEAHGKQKRWGGDNYITHPIAVASKFTEEKLKCIAVLHDVIEDTGHTADSLSAKGISKEIVLVVERLSRKQDEPYKDFILRICEDENAIRVKIEDIKHNLSDLTKGSMKDKYELALIILKDKLRRI